MKTFAVKLDDETVDKFNEVHEALVVEKGASYLKGQLFEDMLYAYLNPKTKDKIIADPEQQRKIDELNNEIKDLSKSLQDRSEFIEARILFINSICKLLGVSQSEDVIPEIQKIQQRAMTVPDKEFVQRPLADNEIQFSIPEPTLSIINEVKKRLSDLYEKPVTAADILLDMFIRYNVEQFAEWFYPFTIKSDSDFKQVSGYTRKELIAWLKK